MRTSIPSSVKIRIRFSGKIADALDQAAEKFKSGFKSHTFNQSSTDQRHIFSPKNHSPLPIPLFHQILNFLLHFTRLLPYLVQICDGGGIKLNFDNILGRTLGL